MTSPDLNPVTIQSQVLYSFNTATQQYIAKISMILPIDEKGNIVEILRDNNTAFLGGLLYTSWGLKNVDHRIDTIELTDKSLNNLKSVVAEYIGDQIEIIQTVAFKNRDSISRLPVNVFMQDYVI